VFDAVEYDPRWDLLYLRCSEAPLADDWNVTDAGDALAFRDGQLISVDVANAGLRLAKTDGITITQEGGTVLRSPDVHLALRVTAA
jgi:uncharacterized protein YuzE